MRRNLSTLCLILGGLFLLYALVGRYWVLPGYLSSLEQGRGTPPPSPWKIARFVLWGFSFKISLILLILGQGLRVGLSARKLGWGALAGSVYLATAFAPIPGPVPLFFGVGGVLIALLFVLILLQWARLRPALPPTRQTSLDVALLGVFFFAMASYNLCGLLGVSAFGLHPEKMIRFGLESRAASYAGHVLIELALGFFCFWWAGRGLQKGPFS